jgi:tetratricopeptide (TPR) repeat protein
MLFAALNDAYNRAMGWTDWLSRKDSGDGLRPSLRDVTFDTRGFKVTLKTPGAIEWKGSNNEPMSARIERTTPDEPLPPWTLDALRSEQRQAAAARGGGIVSVTFDRANGIPVAKAITKFKGLGYTYEGRVLVRFRDALYTVKMQADEGSSTGTRETIVSALLMQTGDLTIPVVVPPAKSAPLEGWTRDPYDDTYAGPTEHTLSDDQRLDEILPAHPLSRVRRWLETVQRTLKVAPEVHGELVEPPANESASSESQHRMPAHALGILFMQTGNPVIAERHLSEGIPMRDDEPALDTPRLGDRLMLLGVTRELLGRQEEAAWAHEWSVRAYATAGDGDLTTVRARANLGRVYALLGRTGEADPLLTEAIPVFEASDNTSELAVAMNALGLVRHSQNRHAEALTSFERALTLFETLHGPNHVECGNVLRNIARSAEAAGDRVGSARARKRADEIAWVQKVYSR